MLSKASVCKELVSLFAFVLLVGSLFSDQCVPRNVCPDNNYVLDYVTNYSVNAHSLNLNSWLSERLGNSISVIPSGVNSDCNDFSESAGLVTFTPVSDCQIQISRVLDTEGLNADINRDGIVDDADLLNVLFDFGKKCNPADVNRDENIDYLDLMAVLYAFGTSGKCLPEDINLDGIVDDGDLLLVLFGFGSESQCTKSDITRDGIVDDGDLLLVLFCFGSDGIGCIETNIHSCSITVNVKVAGKDENTNGGNNGTSNQTGQNGATGNQGTTGNQGSEGGQGFSGSSGLTGGTGQSGSAGQNGTTGGSDDGGIHCTETDFRPSIRTMDHNTRSIVRQIRNLLVYIYSTNPARNRPSLRNDIRELLGSTQNTFSATWTFLWGNLPFTLIDCSTDSPLANCVTYDYTPIYSKILGNEAKMVNKVKTFLSKIKRLYVRRTSEWKRIQRMFNSIRKSQQKSASFISSLPISSVICT
ncbi:MAG: hypothetical protein NZT61_02005 [Deltaproteobacteria bacterium]|nr:hypothetical protein [Deltaproteobacteria bacterium]